MQNKHVIESKQEHLASENAQAELIIYHHSLTHLTLSKIRILSLLGIITKRIYNTEPPNYKGCINEAITKRQWRTDGRQANNNQMVTSPVQCVLVDQLVSPLSGVLSQLKDIMTKQKYRSTIFFVDHFRRIRYVHLYSNLTQEEILKADQDFDA